MALWITLLHIKSVYNGWGGKMYSYKGPTTTVPYNCSFELVFCIFEIFNIRLNP